MMTREELRANVDGIAFMTVTPFHENGEVDYDGYRENVRFLVSKIKENPCKCTITPCGSNGASTKRTIEISRYAQSVGADGVQVILPYYFVPTVDGMLEHYKLLADELDIGMVIYNNPAFSGSWIKPAQMKKLIELTGDKIVAVKENTPHLMLFNGMAKALKGTGVKLLSGFGEQWYAYQFPWGADGLATPFGNFFPEYPIGFKKAADQYDFAAMREWLARMDRYYAFVGKIGAARGDTGMLDKPGGNIYGEGNVRFGVIKEAMNLMGLHGGDMRAPLKLHMTDDERAELKDILRELQLL